MCGTSQIGSTTSNNSNGIPQTMGYSFGNSQGWMNNPALIDPSMINPSMAPYLQNMEGMASSFSGNLGKTLDPNFYNSMRDEFGQRSVTGVNNQYARMGLAGSSAEAGAAQNALRTNDMQWHDRQLSDQLRALQAGTMMDQNVIHNISGIQDQYGDFQNEMFNTLMGMQSANNQAQASELGAAGQGFSGLASGAGTAAAAL